MMVAPLAGARIEIMKAENNIEFTLSLPSRERGLKFADMFGQHSNDGRSPRGSAD